MTNLLNLPGVIVEDSKQTGSVLILSVRMEKKIAKCPLIKAAIGFIKIKDI
jgi:transposase